MSLGTNENAVGIFRVDEDRGDLLGVTKAEVDPGFPGVCGFVDTVAGSEIGALQSFATAHVNNVGVGRGNGKRADGAGGLIVKYRVPGVPEISGLPDAAIDGGHVEDVRLMRHAGYGDRAASTERPDATPAHLGKEFLVELLADLLVELLRVGRSTKNTGNDDSNDEALPCRADSHPSPP